MKWFKWWGWKSGYRAGYDACSGNYQKALALHGIAWPPPARYRMDGMKVEEVMEVTLPSDLAAGWRRVGDSEMSAKGPLSHEHLAGWFDALEAEREKWRTVVGSDDPVEVRRMLDEAHEQRTWVPSEVWLRENGYVKISPSAGELLELAKKMKVEAVQAGKLPK